MSVKVLLISKILNVIIISPQYYLKSEPLGGFKNTLYILLYDFNYAFVCVEK